MVFENGQRGLSVSKNDFLGTAAKSRPPPDKMIFNKWGNTIDKIPVEKLNVFASSSTGNKVTISVAIKSNEKGGTR